MVDNLRRLIRMESNDKISLGGAYTVFMYSSILDAHPIISDEDLIEAFNTIDDAIDSEGVDYKYWLSLADWLIYNYDLETLKDFDKLSLAIARRMEEF